MNEQDRGDRANALMGQLFALNMGILFAAFFAIGMWTQGVPRALSTLAGFITGLLVVSCFPLARLCVSRLGGRVRWLSYSTAAICTLAFALSWSVDVGMRADTQWPYAHHELAVAAGMAWMVASLVLLTFFCWWSDRNTPQAESLAHGLLTLAAAGVICQLLASTVLIGGPRLWPSHAVNTLARWYPWLSQGVAGGLISAGGIGMSALSWLSDMQSRRLYAFGCVAWSVGLAAALGVIAGEWAWRGALSVVAGALVIIWLVLVGLNAVCE